MKRQIFAAGVFVFFLTATGFGVPKTEICYHTSDLGSGRWQYSYDVTNISLTVPIEEFTIWFKFGLYDNLAIETPDTPPGWNQIVVQPEPVLKDDGYYDALSNVGIGPPLPKTVSGFAVSFDWLGDAVMPGAQFYEIIDPVTFETIDSGYTVPEPATLLLLGLGGLMLRGKRWPQRGTKATKKLLIIF